MIFLNSLFPIKIGDKISRQSLLYKTIRFCISVEMIFEFQRGTFRVRGDVIDIIPAYEDQEAMRIRNVRRRN